VKIISRSDANPFLDLCGVRLDPWARLVPKCSDEVIKFRTIRGPRAAEDLFAFSLVIASWMKNSLWVIAQINHASGWMDPYRANFLFGGETLFASSGDAVLFEPEEEVENRNSVELPWARMMFGALMFELHVDFIWSTGQFEKPTARADGGVAPCSESSRTPCPLRFLRAVRLALDSLATVFQTAPQVRINSECRCKTALLSLCGKGQSLVSCSDSWSRTPKSNCLMLFLRKLREHKIETSNRQT